MDVKVSAIVPVYNTEKFLEKCIRSIMSQTLKEIEIICINDGSTDNSLEILKKLQKEDKRIIIIDKKNEGISIARNKGIEQAKGEYISFIDSDDWIESNCYEEIFLFSKKNRADIVIMDYYCEYQKNRKILYEQDGDEEKEVNKVKLKNEIFLGKRPGFVWNKLISHKIISKENMRFNTEIIIGEDLYFLNQLINKAKYILKLNKGYIHYVQHENSTCRKVNIEKIRTLYENLDTVKKELPLNIYTATKVNWLSWLLLDKNIYIEKENHNLIYDLLDNIKKVDLYLIKSLKLKIIVLILKLINTLNMFIIVFKINNNIKKIKKYLYNFN